MKLLLLTFHVLISAFFFSCGTYYDEEYYEKASGIRLPPSKRLIESFDNGEHYTISSFKLSPDDMRSLIREYGFEGIKRDYRPTLFGISSLNKEKPHENDLANCVYVMRSNGKVHSNYLADTVRGLLWASISYPDWGGQ